jgi:hypothetical protein
MHASHVMYGYWLKNIAGHLATHYTTASKALKKTDNSRPDPIVVEIKGGGFRLLLQTAHTTAGSSQPLALWGT